MAKLHYIDTLVVEESVDKISYCTSPSTKSMQQVYGFAFAIIATIVGIAFTTPFVDSIELDQNWKNAITAGCFIFTVGMIIGIIYYGRQASIPIEIDRNGVRCRGSRVWLARFGPNTEIGLISTPDGEGGRTHMIVVEGQEKFAFPLLTFRDIADANRMRSLIQDWLNGVT